VHRSLCDALCGVNWHSSLVFRKGNSYSVQCLGWETGFLELFLHVRFLSLVFSPGPSVNTFASVDMVAIHELYHAI